MIENRIVRLRLRKEGGHPAETPSRRAQLPLVHCRERRLSQQEHIENMQAGRVSRFKPLRCDLQAPVVFGHPEEIVGGIEGHLDPDVQGEIFFPQTWLDQHEQ